MTFHKACHNHIKNYTSGHESLAQIMGQGRTNYPDNHIEIDNRLVWFLGRLEREYGDNAYYVHLIRNRHEVARSLYERFEHQHNIVRAYYYGILQLKNGKQNDILTACEEYVTTCWENIEAFLKDKTRVFRLELETAQDRFGDFVKFIGADCDVEKAKAEFDIKYNKSKLSGVYVDAGKVIKT